MMTSRWARKLDHSKKEGGGKPCFSDAELACRLALQGRKQLFLGANAAVTRCLRRVFLRSSSIKLGFSDVSDSISLSQAVDRSTCWASRISTEKESFPGSEFKPASIWTCWMLIDRQMQSAFMPELHRWISKLTARHLHHQDIFWSPW